MHARALAARRLNGAGLAPRAQRCRQRVAIAVWTTANRVRHPHSTGSWRTVGGTQLQITNWQALAMAQWDATDLFALQLKLG